LLLVDPVTNWHIGAKASHLEDILIHLNTRFFPGRHLITVRGELLGPGMNGNIYGFKDLHVRLFDIEVDSKPIDAEQFFDVLDGYEWVVPVLWKGRTLREFMDENGYTTMDQASTGKSVLGDTLREGICIRPMHEQCDHKLGRLLLKQRSSEYLATHDT
jgi:hypothetical protein